MKSLLIASLCTVPGFAIAWILSNHFGTEDYSFFLLLQNLSIGINLILNFGLNTFMLKYKNNSSLRDAINEIQLIYLIYFILSTLICFFYYFQIYDKTIGLISFIIPAVVGSILLLFTSNFQQYFIGQGRMNYAHIYFIACPKIIGIIVLFIFYIVSIPFTDYSIWFYIIQLLFISWGLKVPIKLAFSSRKSLEIVKLYSYQWSAILLHGIYSPLLIMYLYSVDLSLVPTLGVAILISQPARMVYQFSIQTKIKIIKERIKIDGTTKGIEGTYQKLAFNSSVLIAFYIFSLYLFENIITEYIFPNIKELFQYSLFFITYQFINAVFGPNGTVLALINKSHYDANSALAKVLFLFFLMVLGCDAKLIMILMMFIEILVNVYKNIKLKKLLNETFKIYFPILVSLSVVTIEAFYFGI